MPTVHFSTCRDAAFFFHCLKMDCPSSAFPFQALSSVVSLLAANTDEQPSSLS
jgi:hypothetical protein